MDNPKSYYRMPGVVQAAQWFRNGDHPNDNSRMITPEEGEPFLSEGEVVRRYRSPDMDGQTKCQHCGEAMHDHGWIDAPVRGRVVCPGDYIVANAQGEYFPYKLDIFEAIHGLSSERPNDIRVFDVAQRIESFSMHQLLGLPKKEQRESLDWLKAHQETACKERAASDATESGTPLEYLGKRVTEEWALQPKDPIGVPYIEVKTTHYYREKRGE